MPESVANPKRVGIARALSKLGYCSRSQAAELVRTGRVKLNGVTSKDPEKPARIGLDKLEVDNKRVCAQAKVYLMLNKPRGVVTTASDEKGRKTVYESLDPGLPWLGPVGRLDKASEGLLLLTNDSEWAARISDPSTHLDKTYHVQVDSLADPELLTALITGIVTRDGERLRVKAARPIRTGERNSWLEITLDEGKNRQIRRMFEKLEIEVLRLIRVAVGPLELGQLGKNRYRMLTSREKSLLDRANRKSAGK